MEDIPVYLLNYLRNQGKGRKIEPNLQEKTETITTNTTTIIEPDSGYDGLSKVSVITNIPTSVPDWSKIGYNSTPESVIKGFNYAKKIKDNWDITVTNFYQKYRYDYQLVFFPADVDCSAIWQMREAFIYAYALLELPALNTSSCTTFQKVCNNCYSLKKVGSIDMSESTNISSAFANCYALEDFDVMDWGKVVQINGCFYNCKLLTNDSLNNIMTSLLTANSISSSNKNLTVIFDNDVVSRCIQLENWTALENAGWISGL